MERLCLAAAMSAPHAPWRELLSMNLMIAFIRFWLRALLSALALFLPPVVPAMAQDCCDPAGPFRPGEAYAEQPATCETIGRWIERAPEVDRRITLTVRGALSAVETDGVLAYLIMCPEPGVQVMCVAYSTNDMKLGDVVTFGGGYSRVGKKQVMLDPCLASRE